MHRWNPVIIIFFFLTAPFSWSLTTVSTGSYSVKEGDTVEIVVSVASPNLSSFTLQIHYNSQLLEYNDTLNRIRSTIPVSRANQGTLVQVGVSTNPPGILTFPFFNPDGNSVNSGSGILFSFRMKGLSCGVSSLTYTINAKTTPETNDTTSFTNGSVTITDITKPLTNCKNITVPLDGNGQAAITGTSVDNGSTDNCQIQSLTVSPNTFTCANLGQNQVILTVTDSGGNTAACNATVTIQDNILPSITCPANMVIETAANETSAVVTGIGPVNVTDNCSVSVGYILSGATTGSGAVSASGVSFNLGITTITYTATDAAGNTRACQFTVTLAQPAPWSHVYTLHQGWNLISFPGKLSTSTAAAVQLNNAKIGKIWTYDNANQRLVENTLESLPANTGCWIYLSASFPSLTLSGNQFQSSTLLKQNWNLAGVSNDITNLSSISGIRQPVWSWNGKSYLASPERLNANLGYWINAASDNLQLPP